MVHSDSEGSDSDREPILSSDQFKDRHDSCTDIPCCALWAVCLIALGCVVGYGYKNGNTKKLHHFPDKFGQICGVDAAVATKPNLYYCPPSSMNPLDVVLDVAGGKTAQEVLFPATNGFDFSRGVCVTTCPGSLGGAVPECGNATGSTVSYQTSSALDYCIPKADLDASATTALAARAAARAAANTAGGRRLSAVNYSAASTQISDALKAKEGSALKVAMRTITKAADSTRKGYPVYLIAFFVAVVLGYAFLFLLRVAAKPLVYGAILVAFLAFLLLGIYLFKEAKTLGTNSVLSQNFGQNATQYARIGGGIALVIAVIILCMAFCLHSSIEMALIAVKMTCQVMSGIPSLLFAPVIKAVAKTAVFLTLVYWFALLVSCYKTTKTEVQGTGASYTTTWKTSERLMMYFLICMGAWIWYFLTAIYQFSVAFAAADYFYAEHMDSEDGDEHVRDVHCCNFLEGTYVGLMYHQGSLAMGGFIVAVFWVLQRIVEILTKQNEANPVARLIGIVCGLCLRCCQSCAEFLNKNAYIDMAVKGNGFCASARNAFSVMVDNAGAMAILNGVTWIFQLAGLLSISGISLFIIHAVLKTHHFTSATSRWFIEYPPIALVISFLIAFAVASAFMDAFDMVSDTIIYCLGLDGWGKSGKQPPCVRQAMEDGHKKAKTGHQYTAM